MHGRGNRRIEGRLKEMIIRGGENFPREIEDVIVFIRPWQQWR
jgi:acyl-CoA synthetase (AMP-forming)/AMP-acid ligase II